MSWKLGDLSYKHVHFFVTVHDFICIYLGKIWPIYRKIMQNIPTSRNPTDMLHIFNLYKYMYTYNVHAVMSSIVWTRRLSLLTPLQSGGGVYFTVFSRFFHALLGSLLILLGSLLILLGSSSRKPHGNFTVVFLHPHQLKGSENSRFLLSENGRNHWIYGANVENNMLTSSSALRGLCSEKLLFFATEHVFSTHEPWIFMLYVIKKLS